MLTHISNGIKVSLHNSLTESLSNDPVNIFCFYLMSEQKHSWYRTIGACSHVGYSYFMTFDDFEFRENTWYIANIGWIDKYNSRSIVTVKDMEVDFKTFYDMQNKNLIEKILLHYYKKLLT